MQRFGAIAISAAVLFAQSDERGEIRRHGNRATLIVDSPRPLDSAALTLAHEFGISINSEEATGSTAFKAGRIELDFDFRPDGRPADMEGLLRDLVEKTNGQLGTNHRLEFKGGAWTILPSGSPEASLLDRRVTIPFGVRPLAESASLLGVALSAQTGLKIHCGQPFVAGVPWGMESMAFSAKDEIARDVLRRLIHGSGLHWLQRCGLGPSRWCLINLVSVRQP